MAATKTAKQVVVISRIKEGNTVTYKVLSSNGRDEYKTTFVDGQPDGCTCPARVQNCYHVTQLQEQENAYTDETLPLMGTPEMDALIADLEASLNPALPSLPAGFKMCKVRGKQALRPVAISSKKEVSMCKDTSFVEPAKAPVEVEVVPCLSPVCPEEVEPAPLVEEGPAKMPTPQVTRDMWKQTPKARKFNGAPGTLSSNRGFDVLLNKR